MTEQVLVKIKGVHYAAGAGDEQMELITVGRHEQSGAMHAVEYEERLEDEEGGSAVVKNRLIIDREQVELQKSGDMMMHTVFKKNFRSASEYRMPMGVLDMVMETKEIQVEDTPELIRIHILYGIELNGAHATDCTMEILIQPVESDD